MKPVIFDYSQPQKEDDFPSLEYCRKLNLNLKDGIVFASSKENILLTSTKTETMRETDDVAHNTSEELIDFKNNVLFHMTKTNTVRETDD